MKAISIIIVMMILLMASPRVFAVDKVTKKSDSSKLSVSKHKQHGKLKQYQNFIDSNRNGIDDKLEKSRKTATNIQPKPEQESAKQPTINSTDKKELKPDNQKIKNKSAAPVKTDKVKTEKK